MIKTKKMSLIGQLMLLLTTLVWGSSFLILKQTINEVPPFFAIAIRFVFAGGVLALVFIKRIRASTKKAFFQGVIMGLSLFLAYIFQTIGLVHTTPGRNAFLTSSYCVMCPFLVWMIFRKKPRAYNLISAILCIVGIGLVALSGESSTGESYLLGDGLTIVCAIFFALQIIEIDRFQKSGSDAIVLLTYQLLTVAVLFTILTLAYEVPVYGIESFKLHVDQILKIAYLSLYHIAT